MATGTDAGLLNEQMPQSTYKHVMLDQYGIRYATMTASKLPSRRAVLFDGYAGRGRFDNGSAASAEHMMLAAQKVKKTTQIDCFFVEKKLSDFQVLESLAEEYRAGGLKIVTRHGECGDYIDELVRYAKGASLFLFIDPCGATLPWGKLAPLLKQRGAWPRTELLMNFNADLVRRAGGQVLKHQMNEHGVKRLNIVCDGDWWQQLAIDTFHASGGMAWEEAAKVVALEYARRLCDAVGNIGSVVAPVRRQAHHQPVYYLIFLTHDVHGFWVMGNAASKAREAWLRALGPDEDDVEGMLFNPVEDQIAHEHEAAAGRIKKNIVKLISDGQAKRVVESTREIFDGVYGQAKETAFSKALRELVTAGEVDFVKKGTKPHQHVIRKLS
jgi:three-Cys-motif partner protein